MSNGGDFDVRLWRVAPPDFHAPRIATPPDVHLRVIIRAESKVTALEAVLATLSWVPAAYKVDRIR